MPKRQPKAVLSILVFCLTLLGTTSKAEQDCLATEKHDDRATVHDCVLSSDGLQKTFSVVGYSDSFLADGRSNVSSDSVVFLGPHIYWIMAGSKVDARAFDRSEGLASAVQKACTPSGLSTTTALSGSGSQYIFPDDPQESMAGLAEIHLLGHRSLSFLFENGILATLKCHRR
jgi:hypothetical protein